MERLKLLLTLLLVQKLLLLAFADNTSPLAPAMFIFGDSLIDNGNNNYMITTAKANYFPYGIDSGGPTGRFCNGLTVVDYGARYLGLPSTPPYLSPSCTGPNTLSGVNYASAAAGILDNTGMHYGARTSLSGQTTQFEATLLKLSPFFQSLNELGQFLERSIFVVNIGSNDYLNNYLLPDRYDSSRIYSGEGFADHLINILSQQLTRLYRLGARKIVMVGAGPLGCIPNYLSKSAESSCLEEVNTLVSQFNSRLIQLIGTLNNTLPGSIFVYHNIYDRFSDMVANPSSYGFIDANDACCGNGRNGGELTCLPLEQPCLNRDQYIFWDSYHPTQAANAIIAKNSYSQDATDCIPINIYELAQL